jgi:hypothetical protein
MDNIYSLMGVCPQHDLLWATLTGSQQLLREGFATCLSWMQNFCLPHGYARAYALC